MLQSSQHWQGRFEHSLTRFIEQRYDTISVSGIPLVKYTPIIHNSDFIDKCRTQLQPGSAEISNISDLKDT